MQFGNQLIALATRRLAFRQVQCERVFPFDTNIDVMTHANQIPFRNTPQFKVVCCPMPRIAIIMGSKSDWDTMSAASETLDSFGIKHVCEVVSAHRTPELMFEFAKSAAKNKFECIIAGAGGAAHLPGMVASLTTLPVLGVPVQSKMLSGIDSLLSIVQMPAGVPTATFSIGPAGAVNAALFAIRIMAINDAALTKKLLKFRETKAKESIESTRLLQKKTKK